MLKILKKKSKQIHKANEIAIKIEFIQAETIICHKEGNEKDALPYNIYARLFLFHNLLLLWPKESHAALSKRTIYIFE